jgi:hypothetical protein
MSTSHFESDYLVIGAGATAMAFVDTLLHESDARVLMVDRHHRPGGHWNDAYPFVRLHQPSAFYGVNSRDLGSGSKDAVGLNQGLYELACGAEVVNYFDQVMNQQFLPSGRVRYFPMSHYEVGPAGEHRFTSLVSGASGSIDVRKCVVNATLARTEVPSTHPPRYDVAAGVRCVPLNELPRITRPNAGYVVVGSGKTGIDACLWLLGNGAAPASIRWIMPRDAWFLDRANVQPGHDFFEQFIGSLVAQLESIVAAESIPDLFARLEAAGQLLRIDPSVEPTMYRCATVTQAELRELRRIESIVRLGRVRAIELTRIVLERGSIATQPDCLYIDCSANGIPSLPAMPVFEGNTINLQMLRTCQPVFSAALIAYVESHVTDLAEKNALCRVVPLPVRPTDWIRMWSVSLGNRHRWGSHEGLSKWLAQSRLDGVTRTVLSLKDTETQKKALLQRYQATLRQAAARLPQLMEAVA